jgi:hypothetical protein
MKTLLSAAVAALVALSFSSCHLKEAYRENESAAAAYLEAKRTVPPRINVEGLWYSPEWGMVIFNQESGGKVTGLFRDHYHIRGIVCGRNVFLLLNDNNWHEYTVELRQVRNDKMTGFYSAHVPFSESDKQPVTLYKIVD